MEPILRHSFSVQSYDVDFRNKARLSTLVDYIQETGSQHAEHLGLGYALLREKHVFWALIRLAIEVYRYPSWGQRITVSTWPKHVKKIFAFRDYEIRDEDGTQLAGCVSQWIMLDATTRKPVSVEPFAEGMPLAPNNHALPYAPPKIGTFDHEPPSHRIEAAYSDVDMNNHVNNSKYIAWVLDTFDDAFHRTHIPQALSINYINEAVFGDVALVAKERDGSEENVFRLKGYTEAGADLFAANVRFRKES